MKTCTQCKIEKPVTKFYKNIRRKDGHASECKMCGDICNKCTRDTNKHQYNEYRNNWKRQLFEHTNLWKKQQDWDRCWDRFMKESAKCIVICSNCRKKIQKDT